MIEISFSIGSHSKGTLKLEKVVYHALLYVLKTYMSVDVCQDKVSPQQKNEGIRVRVDNLNEIVLCDSVDFKTIFQDIKTVAK